MKTSRSTIILTEDSGSRDGKTVVIGSSVGIEVGAVVVGEGEAVVVNRSGLDISREEAVEGDLKEGIMVVRSRDCLLYTSPSPRDS